jgi:hypothetical protein
VIRHVLGALLWAATLCAPVLMATALYVIALPLAR